MYFDVLTTGAVVDELCALLVGGRVQDVLDLTEDAVGLEIYANHRRHYLLLSADHQSPRVHLVESKLRRGLPKPTQLGLLLRRYVEGAELTDVTQPPWERLILFHLDGPEGVSELIVEAVERRSNILLVQGGVILDCIRRVGPQENRVRLSLPGHEYVPPPPQVGRLRPDLAALEDLEAMLDAEPGKPAWRALAGGLLGVSPLLARELVFRAMGSATLRAGDTSARSLLKVIQDVWPPLLRRAWQPGITRDENGVTAFAVYPITHLPGWEPVESVSAALAAYYGALAGADAYEAAKVPVRQQLAEAMARLERKAESLRESLKSEAELIHLRQAGELLLAYQYTIPRGAARFSAEYDPGQPPVEITLDPSLSPLDNAKQYFERYDKAKRALAGVPELLRAAENELAFLRQLDADLTFAANWPEIDEVRDALEREGYWRGPRQARPRGGQSGPLRVTTPEGFTIWVGRNSRQNDQVTFTKGASDDLWLHARGVPGAHVIVKTENRAAPDAVIRRAAELAAFFSTARDEARVLVDVTRRKYVRKIKGGKPGMVTYRNEEPVEVAPRGPD